MSLRKAMFKCAEVLQAIPEAICVRPCLSGDGKFAAFVLNTQTGKQEYTTYADDPIAAVNKLRRFHE
jgi:hypothetical protein